MIIELVKAGKRVGITAGSHKVISNLLSTLCDVAGETNTKLRIVQKPNEGDGCRTVRNSTYDNSEVIEKYRVASRKCGRNGGFVAGGIRRSVDVLFVDEAGQSPGQCVAMSRLRIAVCAM